MAMCVRHVTTYLFAIGWGLVFVIPPSLGYWLEVPNKPVKPVMKGRILNGKEALYLINLLVV
jgi:hypothetical protein